MPADRRVGAQRKGAERLFRLGVQRLAHAVQALRFHRDALLFRHQPDRGQRMGVVRGELRIKMRRRVDQHPRADQIAEVRRRPGGVDRIVLAAHDLRALDFRVPIGALDEADHQPPPARLRQRAQGGDHFGGALLIRLHGEAETGPAAQLRLARQPVQHRQRQDQPVAFLGVEREMDVGARGLRGKTFQARIKHRHHVVEPRRLIARIERRQLDRNAVIRLRPLGRDPGQRGDGARIGFGVAFGVGHVARAFAQHVERAQIALRLRALQRRLDGPAQHELLAHDADRLRRRLADHRLADAPGQMGQIAGEVALGLRLDVDHAAGEHQPPGRGVDEPVVRPAQMRRPVGGGDLLVNQRVARRLVRRAQQRLGQAHQRQPLRRAERKFLQEAFDHALLFRRPARGGHQRLGVRPYPRALRRIQRRGAQQPRAYGRVGHVFAIIETIPVRRLHGEGVGEIGCGVGHGVALRAKTFSLPTILPFDAQR